MSALESANEYIAMLEGTIEWIRAIADEDKPQAKASDVLHPSPGEIMAGEMKDELGYDPEGDSPLDALIAYKNACEDRMVWAIDELQRVRTAAA